MSTDRHGEGRPAEGRPKDQFETKTDDSVSAARAEALNYAEAGYPVIPCHTNVRRDDGTIVCTCGGLTPGCAGGKHPLAQFAPKGANSKTSDPAVIATWPEDNFQIGLVTDDKLVDIDIDLPRVAQHVLTDEELLEGHFVIRSGRDGGGAHVWAICSEPTEAGVLYDAKTGEKIGELRAAGQYGIVPPALHASGNQYEWVGQRLTALPYAEADFDGDGWMWAKELFGRYGIEVVRHKARRLSKEGTPEMPQIPEGGIVEVEVTEAAIGFEPSLTLTDAFSAKSFPEPDRSGTLFGIAKDAARAAKLAGIADFDPLLLAGMLKRKDRIWEHPLGPKYAARADGGDGNYVITALRAQEELAAEEAARQGEGEATMVANEDKPSNLEDPHDPKPDAGEPALFECTEVGNAMLFAHIYGDQVRWDPEVERWLRWRKDLHRWVPFPAGKRDPAVIWRMAITSTRQRFEWSWRYANKDIAAAQAKWARRSRERKALTNLLYHVTAIHPVDGTGIEWDAHPYLLVCGNGVLDLKTLKLRAGRLEDHISCGVKTNYNRAARCPRWEQYLEEVFEGDEELIAFAQRALGYSITGDVSEQVVFICYGLGSNGKTVLLTVMYELLGGERGGEEKLSYNLPGSALQKTAKTRHPTDIVKLKDKRFAYSVEVADDAELDEERFKQLSGEKSIPARLMHKDWISFPAKFKTWLGVNHLPRVSDVTEAFWRRPLVIPFERMFVPGEREPNLAERLIAEESEGILAWLAQGAQQWYEHGLMVPGKVKEATEAYRAENDSFSAFVVAMFEQRSGRVGASEAYNAYLHWADQTDQMSPYTTTEFGKKLGQRFPKRRERDEFDRQRWFYRGLELRYPETADRPEPKEITKDWDGSPQEKPGREVELN